MRRSGSSLLFLLVLLLLLPVMVFSQQDPENGEEEDIVTPMYSLGDQMFFINGGIMVPLFFQSLTGEVKKTNLSIGGAGSLAWSAFLNNKLFLGAELGGMFAVSPLKRVLIQIPITARIGYMFHRYPFDFPLLFGTGIIFTKLQEELYVGPVFKPGFSFYWNITNEWALGLNCIYWWVPQIYTKDLKNSSRFGNFLEISFSGLFHF